MSDLDRQSMPSSDNDSTRDYEDKEDIVNLYPEDRISSNKATVEASKIRSTKIHVPPSVLRLEDQIRDILGESSDQYVTFLARIIYDSKYNNQPVPTKYKMIVEYINKRI